MLYITGKIKYLNAVLIRFILSVSPEFIRKKWSRLPFTRLHEYMGLFFNYEHIINWKGVKIRVNPSSTSDFHIYFFNSYEDNVYKKLIEVTAKNCTFVDVGSNQGLFALPVANNINTKLVVAFEPDRHSSSRLLGNLDLNKEFRDKVRVVRKVVYDYNGQIDFLSNEDQYENQTNRVSIVNKNISSAVKYDCIRLDDFCFDNNILPDVVKIDVEGAEYNVLKGMESMLKEGIPKYLLVELHPVYFNEQEQVLLKSKIIKILNTYNYRIYRYVDNDWCRTKDLDFLDYVDSIFCEREQEPL